MDKNLGFKFLEHCNNYITNENEFQIARILVEHINDIENISLDSIANESYISVASISRFIKKIGFKSFPDFKREILDFKRTLHFNRTISHMRRFQRNTTEQIVQSLYNDATNNLQQTLLKMDYNKLNIIVERLLDSKNVIFIGAQHDLDIFYTTQLDLIANNVSCYLTKIPDKQRTHFERIDKDTTVVVISVFNDFNINHQEMIETAKKNGAFVIAFSQEEFFIPVDINYTYGIANSINDGYYSLEFIAKIIDELLYK